MVQPKQTQAIASRDTANSSLDALSRTLEALESRLSRIAPAAAPRSAEAIVPPPAAPAAPPQAILAPVRTLRPSGTERRRPSLADAVSEIAMRRQMLDGAAQARPLPIPVDRPVAARAADPVPAAKPPVPSATSPDHDEHLDKRFQSLAGDVEALRADGSNFSLMAEVAEELQRLRQELRRDDTRGDPRFDAMREAFDALRRMIETRQSADVIGAEMSEIAATLARLTEEGADRSTLNTLRAELEEMRSLFGEMAKEKTVADVGQRWDAFETRFSKQTERDTEARGDLKNELERLRESLRSLASEDHVRAVEKRWDDFEDRYLGATAATAVPAPSDAKISQLLRDELEVMREKLEGMADAAPMKAVEARWGALEERLDSRDIEASILTLAERMGEIEATLERLPGSLGIAPLQDRMRALGESVDALANRDPSSDLENFMMLEERLDEISRAIVATSAQPPAFDMAPIERIEARIAMLTSRVDKLGQEGDAEILAMRLAELSDRVEEIANPAVVDRLGARIASLSDRLETVFTELERPRIDTAAIEERLQALALRLEEAVQPRADTEMMRSLEAQIARLTDQLSTVGSLSSDDFDHDFDRRLALVEQRLDENREALIAAARQAADETAARMQAAGDLRQGEHVAQLSQNLEALEQLSRETDDRSAKVFDAVHATLLKIVDRLELIEVEISRGSERGSAAAADATIADRPDAYRTDAHMAAASVMAGAARAEAPASRGLLDLVSKRRAAPQEAAPAAVADQALLERRDPDLDQPRERLDAPSLDASGMLDDSEANRPLEPGSGAPDIGALLERVRLQQRNRAEGGAAAGEPVGEAETRAAARRAVKAAVAEAETLRAPTGTGADADRKFTITDLVARRRKTILVGVTAVLVALAALPIGKSLLSSDKPDAAGGVTLEGNATPSTTSPLVGGRAPEAAAPAAMRPAAKGTSAGPAATQPAFNGSSPTGTVAPSPQSSLSPSAAPGVAKASATGVLLAPATATADAQGFAPRAASISGSSAPATILASAEARLPASTASKPATPEAIGSKALVAAADANDPKALFEIGLRLLEGRGGEPKPADALAWFAQSAKRGFAPAQYSLGTLFEKGNGIARDTGAARDWYLLAALQGNVRAMHNLAVLYATGIEGKSEPETAAEWFEKAADLGMRDSQYNLGILYARGSGVEQSLADSYKWFAVVAKAGDQDAGAKRDEIAKSLAPDQLRAAESGVAAWKAKERKEEANTVDVPQDWNDAANDQTASVDMKRAVRNIQAILGKLGYDAGTPDGVVGGKTTTAILAFQKDSGLSETGRIDETLIRALLERKDS